MKRIVRQEKGKEGYKVAEVVSAYYRTNITPSLKAS